jgi:hypothetical protein
LEGARRIPPHPSDAPRPDVPPTFRLSALAALTLAAPLAAQPAPRKVGSSANAWFDVASDVWLTPVYDLQVGGKVQRAALGAAPQQSELRLGRQRSLGTRFRAGVGGMLVHNSPYGPFPAAAPFGERRLWQQVLHDQRAGRVALQHRYRFEERWIERPQLPVGGVAVAPDVAFGLRARYMLRATVPVGLATAAHAPYVVAYDELFKSVGPHASTNVVDQNRAYVGVGVRWSRALRGEAGYLNQRILRANGRQLEHGHTVQFALGVTRPAPRRDGRR